MKTIILTLVLLMALVSCKEQPIAKKVVGQQKGTMGYYVVKTLLEQEGFKDINPEDVIVHWHTIDARSGGTQPCTMR